MLKASAVDCVFIGHLLQAINTRTFTVWRQCLRVRGWLLPLGKRNCSETKPSALCPSQTDMAFVSIPWIYKKCCCKCSRKLQTSSCAGNLIMLACFLRLQRQLAGIICRLANSNAGHFSTKISANFGHSVNARVNTKVTTSIAVIKKAAPRRPLASTQRFQAFRKDNKHLPMSKRPEQ